ncbi:MULTISPECIES: hypothetical protein [Calothrix]|uniref:Tetratricopeptide repeat protein n=2 Tax=Calothrix TaxID=1186 RepID=A0ABR8AK45_9CYAN|nr:MULTISPECIES: hypothetical protein [Calothrix]MBD2200358.1 hypothetical protein [Calothrix parietina FACHB-288]MBD2229008.1 hypothetical protein [Calothrix anomala FACHB-343]
MKRLIWKTFGSCITLTALTFASIPAYGQRTFKDVFHNLGESMKCSLQASESSTLEDVYAVSRDIAEPSPSNVHELQEFLIKNGWQRLENKDYARALCYFNQVIDKNLSSKYVSTAYFGRGLTYIKQGDKQRGIADLKAASRLFKSQGDEKNFQKVTRIIQQLTNNGSVTANSEITQPALAGTYSCYYLTVFTGPGGIVLPQPNPSPLGKIQLDGRGRYSSNNFGSGNYVFDSSNSTVHFTDGKMANLVAAYSVNNKGKSGINFHAKLNPGVKFEQSHFCPNEMN